MKAVVFTEYGSPDVLKFKDIPAPECRSTDVVVKNRATGLNPVDVKIRAGALAGLLGGTLDEDHPTTLGWDGAGVICEVGSDVKGLSVGDEVYYAGDVTRAGSYAECTAVDWRVVALKPSSMSFEEAAAIPLVAETAWETLVESFQAKPGQSVLVYNGAGGLGSVTIQLAKALGLTVLATASRDETRAWVKKMGADHVVAHGRNAKPMKEELADAGFDAVDFIFHLHNPTNIGELMKCLKPLGRMNLVNVAAPEDLSKLDTVDMMMNRKVLGYTFMFSRLVNNVNPEMQGELLTEVAKMIDASKISRIDTMTKPWTEATEAHKAQESGKMMGKIVLTIPQEASA